MSHFGSTLQSLMAARGLTAKKVADLSGVHESQISRWLSGKRVAVSREDALAIASLAPSSKAKAELIAARLRDEARGPAWTKMIRITVAGRAVKEKQDPRIRKLARSLAGFLNGH